MPINTVFITFNNRADIPDPNSPDGPFWADWFLTKLSYSAIGVVARSANWFPPDDMQQAIEAILPHLQGRRVVTYSTSMGGYAALKFSKRLHANVGLAFSPQWSNNPLDIGHFDWSWTSCFDPALRGGRGHYAR